MGLFPGPEVTLCSWQDVKTQEPAFYWKAIFIYFLVFSLPAMQLADQGTLISNIPKMIKVIYSWRQPSVMWPVRTTQPV